MFQVDVSVKYYKVLWQPVFTSKRQSKTNTAENKKQLFLPYDCNNQETMNV